MASANPKRKPKPKASTKARAKRRRVGSVSRATKMMRKTSAESRATNPHEGSTLDDFLREEGLFEEATTAAIKETIAFQVAQAMDDQELTKTEMARRMGTSRAALDRILDPANDSVTLGTLFRTAKVLGLELTIELRERVAQ